MSTDRHAAPRMGNRGTTACGLRYALSPPINAAEYMGVHPAIGIGEAMETLGTAKRSSPAFWIVQMLRDQLKRPRPELKIPYGQQPLLYAEAREHPNRLTCYFCREVLAWRGWLWESAEK